MKLTKCAMALLLSAALSLVLRGLGPIVGGDSTAHVYTEMILRQLIIWGLPCILMGGTMHHRKLWEIAPVNCAAAILTGVCAQYLLPMITEASQRVLGTEPAVLPMPSGTLEWVLGVLALVIVPAVTEELFFRAGLQQAMLLNGGGLPEIGLAALIFAGAHTSLTGLTAYMAVGVLLGLTLASTWSIVPCILLHVSYNAMALVWTLWPVARNWLGVVVSLALLAALIVRAWRYRCFREAEERWPQWPLLAAGCVAIVARIL